MKMQMSKSPQVDPFPKLVMSHELPLEKNGG